MTPSPQRSRFVSNARIERIDNAKTEWIGTWGVDGFFVLTGFLLAQPFLRAVLEQQPLPNTRLYGARRFLRIYPLYAVCVMVCAAFVGVTMHEKLAPMSVLAHLTFLHGFMPRYLVDLNWALWTMSVDAQFYVLLPIAAFVLHRCAAPLSRVMRGRLVWGVLAGVAAFSLLERFLVLAFFARHGIEPSFVHVTVYARNVVGMSADFAIGAALAYRLSLAPQATGGRPKALSALLGAVGLAVLMEQSQVHAPALGLVQYWTLVDALGGLSAGLLLYALLRGDFDAVAVFVRRPIIATLAGLAYAMYLFHEPILWVVVERTVRFSGSWTYAAAAAASMLVLTTAIALPLHLFLERPILRIKDRLHDRPHW